MSDRCLNICNGLRPKVLTPTLSPQAECILNTPASQEEVLVQCCNSDCHSERPNAGCSVFGYTLAKGIQKVTIWEDWCYIQLDKTFLYQNFQFQMRPWDLPLSKKQCANLSTKQQYKWSRTCGANNTENFSLIYFNQMQLEFIWRINFWRNGHLEFVVSCSSFVKYFKSFSNCKCFVT